MLCVNKSNFISSFPVQVLFISFCCLVALTRTPSSALNRSDYSKRLHLVPDLGESESFCPMKDVSYRHFRCRQVWAFPPSSSFLKSFIGMLCFLKRFPASIETITRVFFFDLWMWWVTLPDCRSWPVAWAVVVAALCFYKLWDVQILCGDIFISPG